MSDKESTSASAHTGAPDGAGRLPSTPAKRRSGMPRLRSLWLLTLCLSIACWAALALFGSSRIDTHGILHEPLFGLIPVGFSLLFIALVLVLLDLALSLGRRR